MLSKNIIFQLHFNSTVFQVHFNALQLHDLSTAFKCITTAQFLKRKQTLLKSLKGSYMLYKVQL